IHGPPVPLIVRPIFSAALVCRVLYSMTRKGNHDAGEQHKLGVETEFHAAVVVCLRCAGERSSHRA
ncbi:MAG: hypothetical protein ACRD06_06430, partial [Terriglobia bacterium]